jgi:hypothetical protein
LAGDWLSLVSLVGAFFAAIATAYSARIIISLRRGTVAWIWLVITSVCMLFSMLLGTAELFAHVDVTIQRVEQYIFLLAAGIAFVMSGLTLYDLFVYVRRDG